MKKIGWRILPVTLFIMLSVFLWRGLALNPHELPSVQLGKSLPQFNLPQLQNHDVYFNSRQLRNEVILLNVWASWCAACIEEQVVMLQLAREGVPIYGLNYKDETLDALQWLSRWGNPYKMVFQDLDGKVAIDLGVYGAPETFVVDKQGVIRYRHAGVMTQELWQKEIQPLMKQLEHTA
ncbi:MAG: DsbE family thiol:disulfide interchange protein [Legionella sp.]|uniref:DsbE family thiol:disulfide interchange protein n=1 Tax=Legionella sp. TaxID=459 RepID=UPI0039E3912E